MLGNGRSRRGKGTYGSVVVGGVAIGVAEIAPVGSAVDLDCQ